MSCWFEHYGFTEVAPGLTVGAYPQDAADIHALAGAGVDRVLNLVQDVEYEPNARDGVEAALHAAGIEEARVLLEDFGRLPAAQVEAGVGQVLRWLRDGHHVYVHCRAGRQRSVSIAAGALALADGISMLEALDRIRRARPGAEPLVHQREDLATWWRGRA